ncbi:MAG: methylated-DNA--[protein]-cysteine S-methyltransferase [Chloroflexota bacterium]|nr:methylated-DNA--[protein]-cysteine S-methyltransferase [Chloroflexota bacterium]MDE2940997.1 methylated-DNA--[protein]-cysteine S-methyltransferase [Chloroflexota bacterium]MDE3268236.1 methylated-DNA--[protein]-cysteine S-methyltransferase [Chloroflexota bacterium]
MPNDSSEALRYGVFEVAAGWVGILASPAGIRRLSLSPESPADAIERLSGGGEELEASEASFPDLANRLEQYFLGEDATLDDELDLVGTDFQKRAWAAARSIPRGETRSYGWIARSIGNPGAARAVGQAMRSNPVPFIVPCHRVVGSGGAMRGYGGPDGVEMKLKLLAMESDGEA